MLIICVFQLSAQKDPLKLGNEAFQEDRFREALIYYNQIEKIERSAPILFKRGVCYFEINQLEKATRDFERAWEYGYTNAQIDFYTGQIQHHKGNFISAAKYYKKYLRELDDSDISKESIRKLIKQCGRALDLSYKRPLAIIEKLPGGINTAYNELGLIESPSTEGKYYFTSNRPNIASSMSASDYDVYWTTYKSSEWSKPERMKYVINKRDHDILLGFTPSADGLYFYRGKDHAGEIYLNKGIGEKTRTQPLDIPTTLSLLNSDVFFYNDQVILFASRDLQGYGGYDIYASIFNNQIWSKPINLGPEINSSFDETSPYLSFDGSELYFSSNREESIGGYDVFFSSYLYEAEKWGKPENMGIPINAPGDDTHFSLSYDGLTAMLSSDRKNSYGGTDLYVVRFKEKRGASSFTPEQIAFLDYKIPNYPDKVAKESLEDFLLDSNTVVIGKEAISGSTLNLHQDKNIELAFEPIFYSSGIDLINDKNQKEIDKLVELMTSIPSIEISFNCHASEDGILEYKLFSSLKIAERLEQYFVRKGINDSRIHIKGFADNYPIAKSEKEGGDIRYANKYNSRIEIHFSNYDKQNVKLERIPPELPPHIANKKFELYTTLIEDAITYKIQIAVVGQMYRGMALDLFNDTIVEEDEHTGLYVYSIGLYDSYIEALNVKRDMDRLGITDAQVVAYYNGQRLSKDQYVYYVNTFPDLRSLMNYNE